MHEEAGAFRYLNQSSDAAVTAIVPNSSTRKDLELLGLLSSAEKFHPNIAIDRSGYRIAGGVV
jgi:hypothetical protein